MATFCYLLSAFANSLDPDKDWKNVCPDLNPNRLTLWQCSWKNFWEKLILKSQKMTTKYENYPVCKDLMWIYITHQRFCSLQPLIDFFHWPFHSQWSILPAMACITLHPRVCIWNRNVNLMSHTMRNKQKTKVQISPCTAQPDQHFCFACLFWWLIRSQSIFFMYVTIVSSLIKCLAQE